MTTDVENIILSFDHLYIFFCELLTVYLNGLLIFLLSCLFFLPTYTCISHISDKSPLLDTSILKIFSELMACLFIFLRVSFDKRKVLILV